MSTTFLGLYRGKSVSTARLIATTADPDIIADVVARLLAKPQVSDDPVMIRLEDGRRAALRLMAGGAGDE